MSPLLGRSAWAVGLLVLIPPLTQNLAAQTYGVQVSPDGSTISSKTNFTTGLTYTFRVQNEGTQQDTYTLACMG